MQILRATTQAALATTFVFGLLIAAAPVTVAHAQPKADKKPGDAKPAGDANKKPDSAKPAPAGDKKPGDAKPDDAKHDDAKPADKKPGDAKPADKKPGDAKPADKKPAPPVRAAPTPEDMEKAKEAFLAGRKLVEEDKNFTEGVAKFKISYRLSRNALLLYNIGFTLDQMKDKERAVFYYKKFLRDSPEDATNRDLATERLRTLGRELDADDIFDKGTTDKGTTDKGTTDKGTTDKGTTDKGKAVPPEITTFQHNTVEEAPPGKPLDLTAFVPENAKWQVTLFFRGAGQRKFTSTAMRPRYNELVGRIPARVMAGSTIQYYIDARDASGKPVARSGRATSPNLVFIEESAKPQYYPDLTSDRSWDGANTSNVSNRRTGNGGGGGQMGNGGWNDIQSDKFKYAKWGSTGAAAAFLTMSVSFYIVASSAGSSLEGEAVLSKDEQCPTGPPCRAFGGTQKDLQARGERFETLSNVFMGLGIATVGVAGYFWYKELTSKRTLDDTRADSRRKTTFRDRFTATPMVGGGFIGGGATLRF